MRVKIKEEGVIGGLSTFMEEAMENYKGKWLEVDTTYLYQHSFNIVLPECPGKLFRVHNNHITDIINDVRLGLSRCIKCETTTPTEYKFCKKCDNKTYELVPGSSIPEKGFDPVSLIESCFH